MTHVLEGAAEDDRSCPKDRSIFFSGKNDLSSKVVSKLAKYGQTGAVFEIQNDFESMPLSAVRLQSRVEERTNPFLGWRLER